MITNNLENLKIVKLTKEQYDKITPEDNVFYITEDENDIIYSTIPLTPGVSELQSGKLYVVYE